MRIAAAAVFASASFSLVLTSGFAQETDEDADVTRIQLENGEWIEIDASDTIEIQGKRTSKAVNRDTELRLTGEELLARGATTLAEALEEIPQLQVRQAGRGGIQVNIRGGRKGAVKVLIDGAPVDEVFYGTFDLKSIPVTDIAQIRVSTSPSSPLDGVGGPAGVVEVHTIDAVGKPLARLRAQGSSLPEGDVAATGRVELAEGIAVRGSATYGFGRRDFDVDSGEGVMVGVNEDRQQFTGGLRMEVRRDTYRIVVDAFAQQRGYVVPPGEDGSEAIRVIDGESTTRVSALANYERGELELQGRAYFQSLDRETLSHDDPNLMDEGRLEHVFGTRVGTGVLGNHPIGKRIQVLAAATIDSETGELETSNGVTDGTVTVGELASGAQAEFGPIELDGAIGVALPLGGAGDSPWPEAKLSATYHAVKAVDFKVILGRKGRMPTLRERFRADIGNPDLEPEIASFVEVETTLEPTERIKLRTGAYVRDSDGMIRFDSTERKLINVNDLVLRGFDTEGDFEVHRLASVGATYSFTDSYSPQFGLESLDFLPRHRIEGRVAARFPRGSARLRVRYQSTQIDQQIKLPTQTSVDLSAFARVTDSLQASLRFDNVLGDRVQVRRGGVMSPGRVIMLTLQTRWQ